MHVSVSGAIGSLFEVIALVSPSHFWETLEALTSRLQSNRCCMWLGLFDFRAGVERYLSMLPGSLALSLQVGQFVLAVKYSFYLAQRPSS